LGADSPCNATKSGVPRFMSSTSGRKQSVSDLEPEEPETRLPADKARAGVTGHNVRYVLAFGLGGVIVAFAFLLLIYNQ